MLKKLLILAVLIAAVAAVMPAHAETVTATITAPTAATGLEPDDSEATTCSGLDATCEKSVLARHARCLYLANKDAAQSATEGKVGFVFSVTPGNAYTLKPAAGSSGDFDITFYIDMGTCEGATPRGNQTGGKDPKPAAGDQNYDDYSDHHFGNESGTVPAGSTKAIVTLFGGANAKFTYTG